MGSILSKLFGGNHHNHNHGQQETLALPAPSGNKSDTLKSNKSTKSSKSSSKGSKSATLDSRVSVPGAATAHAHSKPEPPKPPKPNIVEVQVEDRATLAEKPMTYTTTLETHIDPSPPHPLEQFTVVQRDLIEPSKASIVPTNVLHHQQHHVNRVPQQQSQSQPEVENEPKTVEEAVIKIQAGVRGFLTRKQLNSSGSAKGVDEFDTPTSAENAIVPPPDSFLTENGSRVVKPKGQRVETPIPSSPLAQDFSEPEAPEEVIVEVKTEELEIFRKINEINQLLAEKEEDLTLKSGSDVVLSESNVLEELNQSISGHEYGPVGPDVVTERAFTEISLEPEVGTEVGKFELVEPEEADAKISPEEAAIRIQAAFRGYEVRKTLSREHSPFEDDISGAHRKEAEAREALILEDAFKPLQTFEQVEMPKEPEQMAKEAEMDSEFLNWLSDPKPEVFEEMTETKLTDDPTLEVKEEIVTEVKIVEEPQPEVKETEISDTKITDESKVEVIEDKVTEVKIIEEPQLEVKDEKIMQKLVKPEVQALPKEEDESIVPLQEPKSPKVSFAPESKLVEVLNSEEVLEEEDEIELNEQVPIQTEVVKEEEIDLMEAERDCVKPDVLDEINDELNLKGRQIKEEFASIIEKVSDLEQSEVNELKDMLMEEEIKKPMDDVCAKIDEQIESITQEIESNLFPKVEEAIETLIEAPSPKVLEECKVQVKPSKIPLLTSTNPSNQPIKAGILKEPDEPSKQVNLTIPSPEPSGSSDVSAGTGSADEDDEPSSSTSPVPLRGSSPNPFSKKQRNRRNRKKKN